MLKKGHLVVVCSQGQGENHRIRLLVGSRLETSMPAQVVSFPLELAEEAGHIGVSCPVCRFTVDIVAKVGVGHHKHTLVNQ